MALMSLTPFRVLLKPSIDPITDIYANVILTHGTHSSCCGIKKTPERLRSPDRGRKGWNQHHVTTVCFKH